jgi:signal transduction histidine kinase
MKPKKITIFRRIAALIFILITGLGLLFMSITYLSTTTYHEASTQLLNKDVAAHIAKFTSPFEGEKVNPRKADSVFYNAMVINPSAEVYFLDTNGKVMAYHSPKKEIRLWTVPLRPIKEYIGKKGAIFIRGADPKDLHQKKIFSASEVKSANKKLGYIYVILGSKKSQGLVDILYGNHIMKLAITAFIAVILLSVFLSILYLKRMQKSFLRMITVVERFERGDYTARFNLNEKDELLPVTQAFNKMADLLSTTITKLTKSEEERKTFIATISHDLRTPLSIARGYTETLMLKRETGDVTKEEQKHYSQLIYNKMLQIENMVKQLFELSKMESIEFKPKFEPFVLSEIVDESVNTFQMMAKERKVGLECVQCLQHVWVNADIRMMERVIQNLVENALKSTPEGGKVIASILTDGNSVIFKVENSGNPLPHDLLRWVNQFESDKELMNNRPAKLGLGLLIVKKILLLHTSNLSAGYENGSNIFSFSLPLYKQTA